MTWHRTLFWLRMCYVCEENRKPQNGIFGKQSQSQHWKTKFRIHRNWRYFFFFWSGLSVEIYFVKLVSALKARVTARMILWFPSYSFLCQCCQCNMGRSIRMKLDIFAQVILKSEILVWNESLIHAFTACRPKTIHQCLTKASYAISLTMIRWWTKSRNLIWFRNTGRVSTWFG